MKEFLSASDGEEKAVLKKLEEEADKLDGSSARFLTIPCYLFVY